MTVVCIQTRRKRRRRRNREKTTKTQLCVGLYRVRCVINFTNACVCVTCECAHQYSMHVCKLYMNSEHIIRLYATVKEQMFNWLSDRVSKQEYVLTDGLTTTDMVIDFNRQALDSLSHTYDHDKQRTPMHHSLPHSTHTCCIKYNRTFADRKTNSIVHCQILQILSE